jgi:hypothetical protein
VECVQQAKAVGAAGNAHQHPGIFRQQAVFPKVLDELLQFHEFDYIAHRSSDEFSSSVGWVERIQKQKFVLEG